MPGLCGPGSPGLGRRRPPKTPAATASCPEMRVFMAIPVFPSCSAGAEYSDKRSDEPRALPGDIREAATCPITAMDGRRRAG